jgi:hypothetical protein
MTTYWSDDTSQTVERHGDTSYVVMGSNYYRTGETSTMAQDTGNGFIIRFFASNSTQQDHYVCLDYSQAHDMILALSAFKKRTGVCMTCKHRWEPSNFAAKHRDENTYIYECARCHKSIMAVLREAK